MGEKSFWEVPTEDGLRIGYLNVDGARNKIDQIEYLAHRYQLDVFFVAETKLDNKVPYLEVGIKDYKIVKRNDKTRNGGGILVYVKENLSNEDLTDHLIQNTEYIRLRVTFDGESINITGVYIPPDSKEKDHKRYKQHLENLSTQDNAILMGDVNTPKFCDQQRGVVNLCVGYTRVAVNKERDSNTLTVSMNALDHIAGNNLNDVKVVERGALHCGISDHALIYCTVQLKKKGGLSKSFVKHGDLLQHDVPLLLSALIVGGDNYDKLTIKSPKFWVMARKMETKRIEISELIHIIIKQENQENLEALQKIQKSPVKFCAELSTSVRDLGSSLKSSIENVRMGSFEPSPAITSQKSIYDELEWYLNTGVRSNKVNENIFLSSRTKYLGFCFPAVQSMLTEDIRVINIQASRTGWQPIMTQSQVDWDDASKRSGHRIFEQPELSNSLFGWKLEEYSRLLSTDPKNQPLPLGLIELGNFLYHLQMIWESACKGTEIGVFFLSNNVMGSESETLQAMKNNVLVYPTGKVLCWTLITSTKDKSNLIQTAGLKFIDLKLKSSYRSVQTLINSESRVSQDMSKVLCTLVNGTTDELKGLIAPRFWLDLPREWIMRENKQGKIAKYAEEFHKEDCSTCKEIDWNTLINNIGVEHANDGSKQCIRHWLNEIKSSIMNGIMFLHSRMEYFNLHVLPDLLDKNWNGTMIVNPCFHWNCHNESLITSIDRIGSAREPEEALLHIDYEVSNYWHMDYYDPDFWDQEKGLIWGDNDPRSTWSEFIKFAKKPYPTGMTGLDSIICHRHLRYKLRDILKTYRGDVIFANNFEGFVHMYIPYASCEPDSDAAKTVTKDIQQIIDTIKEEGKGIEKKLFYSVVGDTDNVIDVVRRAVNDYEHLTEVSYHSFDSSGCNVDTDSNCS